MYPNVTLFGSISSSNSSSTRSLSCLVPFLKLCNLLTSFNYPPIRFAFISSTLTSTGILQITPLFHMYLFSTWLKAIAHWVRNFRMHSVFLYSPSFPMKMHATDAKMQKIEPDPKQKFLRQCANVIDTTWGRIYLLTCENFGLKARSH